MSSLSKQSATLLKHFENLEDPRTEYLVEHRLLDIIGITICAVICGADSWVEIEEYGNSKCEWLKGFLELPNGIPFHDTISRLFAQLDPEKLQSCFLDWIKSIAQLTSGEIIAIDGKTVRHSYDRGMFLVSKVIKAIYTKMYNNYLIGREKITLRRFLMNFIKPSAKIMAELRFVVIGCSNLLNI
jgi:predicted transposase YbfD/YdcC